MFPTQVLQTEIIRRLRVDAAVKSIVGERVYDLAPPQNTAYPFVEVDSWISTQHDTKEDLGWDATFVVHGWTRDRSALVLDGLSSKIFNVLHRKAIVLAGFQVEDIFHISTVYMLESDGVSRHSASSYRAIIYPI